MDFVNGSIPVNCCGNKQHCMTTSGGLDSEMELLRDKAEAHKMKTGFFFRCLTGLMLAAGLHSVSAAQGMVANVGFTDRVAEPQQLPKITLEHVRNDVERASHIQ